MLRGYLKYSYICEIIKYESFAAIIRKCEPFKKGFFCRKKLDSSINNVNVKKLNIGKIYIYLHISGICVDSGKMRVVCEI